MQYVRVPAFRATALRVTENAHRSLLREALKNPALWSAFLKKLGLPSDAPGAGQKEMVEFLESQKATFSAETEWFIQKGFSIVQNVSSWLRDRYWTAAVSSSGSFIGSDNPVSMDGAKGEIGFKTAEIVLFPVSRRVMLGGTNRPVKPLPTTRTLIARHNTFTMLTADE